MSPNNQLKLGGLPDIEPMGGLLSRRPPLLPEESPWTGYVFVSNRASEALTQAGQARGRSHDLASFLVTNHVADSASDWLHPPNVTRSHNTPRCASTLTDMDAKAPRAHCDDCPLWDRPIVLGHGPTTADRVVVGGRLAKQRWSRVDLSSVVLAAGSIRRWTPTRFRARPCTSPTRFSAIRRETRPLPLEARSRHATSG